MLKRGSTGPEATRFHSFLLLSYCIATFLHARQLVMVTRGADRSRCSGGLALHQLVHVVDTSHNFLLGGLDHHASHDHLHQDVLNTVAMENEIQLVHVLENAVKSLDQDLDQVQDGELRFGAINNEDEVQCSVPPVDQPSVRCRPFLEVVDEVAQIIRPFADDAEHLVGELLLLSCTDTVLVEVDEADFATGVDDEHRLDHPVKGSLENVLEDRERGTDGSEQLKNC